jgi:hypothetical protein
VRRSGFAPSHWPRVRPVPRQALDSPSRISISAEWRTQGEHDILFHVPVRACTVSFTDHEGIRHSVTVQAETLYEAVAVAMVAFGEHHCLPRPG